MAKRAEQRERFAAWLISVADARGVPSATWAGRPTNRYRNAWLSSLGLTNARAWLAAQSVPRLHQLPAIAEALEVSLAEVCAAAGRPPSDAVRMRYCLDREGALSTLVHEFRTSRGWTHVELSDHVGISAGTLSRIESGSRAELSPATLVVLADGLGLPAATVAAALRVHPNVPTDMDASAELADSPVASMLRRARRMKGLDRSRAAKMLKVSTNQLSRMERGLATPSEVILCRAAAKYDLPLAELLLHGGHAAEPVNAERMAEVLDLASRRRPRTSFATELTDARKHAGVTNAVLAARVGTNQHVASRWQHGHLAPSSIARVIRIADALNADPVRLVATWSRQAA